MNKKKIINHDFPCKCKILSMDLLSIFLKYKEYKGKKSFIVPLLTEIQNKFGHITEEDVICITEHLNISENKIRKVVESHAEFEIIPVQQHLIRVCRGIVCQIYGSDKILEAACEELKINPGESTDEGKFKLERVGCVGLCQIAPVMAIDNTFYGKIDASDAVALLAHEKQKSKID